MATFIEDGTKIYVTRGDTPTIYFPPIIMSGGAQYTVQASDTLTFRLKKTPYDDTVLLEKTLDNTDASMTLAVADTSGMDFGEYRYSVELVTSDGYHETYIRPIDGEGEFTIGEENENHNA